MDLIVFRKRYPEREVPVGGLNWGIMETRAPAGAPVLLMLPGTLGAAEIFWNQIAALDGRVRVVAVTYPAIDDAVRLVDGLAQLLDALSIESASVIGSSLGGYLAQLFAARHPSRVDHLFIGNSLSDPAANPNRRPAAELKAVPADAHRQVILGAVESWSEPEAVFTELKRILHESGTKLLSAEALKARVVMLAAGEAIPALPIPDERIAVIDCEDDPLIPAAIRDDVIRRYPGAEHLRFPVGGHYPYITRPEAYTALIERRLMA